MIYKAYALMICNSFGIDDIHAFGVIFYFSPFTPARTRRQYIRRCQLKRLNILEKEFLKIYLIFF